MSSLELSALLSRLLSPLSFNYSLRLQLVSIADFVVFVVVVVLVVVVSLCAATSPPNSCPLSSLPLLLLFVMAMPTVRFIQQTTDRDTERKQETNLICRRQWQLFEGHLLRENHDG